MSNKHKRKNQTIIPSETTTPFLGVTPSLGVLCVHGIGMQEKGETLSDFADPIIQAFHSYGKKVKILYPEEDDKDLYAPTSILVEITKWGERRQILFAESHWAEEFHAPDFFDLGGWLLTRGPWAIFNLCIKHQSWHSRK